MGCKRSRVQIPAARPIIPCPNFIDFLHPTALPVFKGGARRAELQRSYAEYRQTTDEYRSIVLNAFREVEDSLSRLRYLSGEEGKRHEATTAALQTQQLQMQLYTSDLTNYLDVVIAQVTALEARLAEVEVQTARLEGAAGMVDLLAADGM